jgi:hypothetical protein
VLPLLTFARTVTPSIFRLNRRRWLRSGCIKILVTISCVGSQGFRGQIVCIDPFCVSASIAQDAQPMTGQSFLLL